MKIMLSAFLKAVVTYMLSLIAFVIAVVIYMLSLIAFVIAVIFSIMIEPIKTLNSAWCAIIDYVRKHISKKRENKDISKLEI